jgi:hypothetical protein
LPDRTHCWPRTRHRVDNYGDNWGLPDCRQTLAKRKASEMLDKLTRKKGAGAGRPAKNNNQVRVADEISEYAEALDEIGVTTQDASRWRTVASFCHWED